MDYQLQTLLVYNSSSRGEITTVILPKRAYTVGVVACGNELGITFWNPMESNSQMTDRQLLIACDDYNLSDYSYGVLDNITPNRLRYLGNATINNGEITYHVFEIQSAIYSEHDGIVG